MKVRIPGRQTLNGTIDAPGSKAYTHRALLASLMTKGRTSILGPSWCDDTRRTLGAIQALGAETSIENRNVVSEGVGEVSPEFSVSIDCGDSGTTLRLLAAVAATSPRWIGLNISSGLAQRPIAPLLKSIVDLGGSVDDSHGESQIRVKGPLQGGETWIQGNVSSQFISGLLFAAPLAQRDVTVHVTEQLQSRPYVEMTIDVLDKHGIKIFKSEDNFHVPAPQEYQPAFHKVPGDFSSASFLIAGAVIAGDEVTINGLNSHSFEPDGVILKLLDDIGVETRSNGDSLTVGKSHMRAFKFDASDNPDLVPPLQLLASFADGESEITGVSRLRFKESNRLESLPAELVKLGAKIAVDNDRIKVHGTEELRGSILNSRGDHRVAMTCSVAAIAAQGESDIYNAEVVSKSYPEFFKDLTALGVELDVE